MAVNCLVRPATTVGLAGVTKMDTNGAAVTVNVVLPVISVTGSVALIVEVPAATPVARPLVLTTVATDVVPDVQVTDAVMSNDVPSE